MSDTVTPYQSTEESKKLQVARMFNNIAHSYDFLNHSLSLGIDILWRKKMIKLLKPYQPKVILDVATGTADVAITAMHLYPEKVVGVDISEGMLAIGRKKIEKKGLSHIITLQTSDSENLHFENNTFDAITVAFGVRNFENLAQGMANMYRVLKENGRLVVLEFSQPQDFPIKQLYNFYFRNILPLFGKLVSRDNAAYTYLPDSVKAFPDGPLFLNIMKTAGFSDVKQISLTFGIASIYVGRK